MPGYDFNTIAKAGAYRITVNSDEQRLTTHTGFFKGLLCKLHLSSTAEKMQNRAVIGAFKRYLTSNFGNTVSNHAFEKLQARMDSGKSLSSGKVKQVLKFAEKHKLIMQNRNLLRTHSSLNSGGLQRVLNRELGNNRTDPIASGLKRLVRKLVLEQPQSSKEVLSDRDLSRVASEAVASFKNTVNQKRTGLGTHSFGLKEVLNPQQFTADRYISRAGIDYLEDQEQLQEQAGIHAGKTKIGRYLYLQDKAKGVEPGFEAIKNWSQGDSYKMCNKPEHKMFIQAGEFIDCHLNSNELLLADASAFKKTALGYIRTLMKPISRNPRFDAAAFREAQGNLTTFLGDRPELKEEIENHVMSSIINLKKEALVFIAHEQPNLLGETFSPNEIEQFKTGTVNIDNSVLAQFDFSTIVDEESVLKTTLHTHLKTNVSTGAVIRKHIQSSRQKFLKKHYVKLDYKEANHRHRWGFGERLEQISRPRNKGLFHRIFKSRGIFHKYFTAHTRREANQSAIMECMANDLMRSMGITTQKMKLIPTEYRDGGTKLLLDGTHMQGVEQDISTPLESFRDFSGRIVDGFMAVRQGDVFVSDSSINKLGKFKIFMLLLADRDSIGSRGDNKGAIGSEFSAIDPGHSLEKQMTSRTLNSDFSFENPKGGAFKNFTVFDDRTYSEKMEGIQQLLSLRETGNDLKVFADYRKTFNGSSNEELDFSREINQKRTDYQARRDYILEDVFGERIAFLGNDHPPKLLDCLDGLEKLTSQTSDVSQKGKVHLRYPRVIQRTEWHISQNEETGEYVLTCAPGRKMVEQENSIRNFLTDVIGIDLDEHDLTSSREDGIRLSLSSEKMGEFSREFTLDKVMRAKHPDSLVIRTND